MICEQVPKAPRNDKRVNWYMENAKIWASFISQLTLY